jgi:hypothetical protein
MCCAHRFRLESVFINQNVNSYYVKCAVQSVKLYCVLYQYIRWKKSTKVSKYVCHKPSLEPCRIVKRYFWLNFLLLTHSLTPWSKVFLEKLTYSQLDKRFLAMYGSRRFITAFTKARHLSISRATSIQFMPPPSHFLKIYRNSISHLRLGLPSGLFPSGFPTKTLYTPLIYSVRAACPPISFFSIW